MRELVDVRGNEGLAVFLKFLHRPKVLSRCAKQCSKLDGTQARGVVSSYVAQAPISAAEAERRVVVAALIARREHGVASRELVIRRTGLSRVEGWSALASLERSGAIWEDEDGVAVGWMGRAIAGLP
jgi:hypothetical protein